MATDRAPEKILKDERTLIEKTIKRLEKMGLSQKEIQKTIRSMRSANKGNVLEAGGSTTSDTLPKTTSKLNNWPLIRSCLRTPTLAQISIFSIFM